MWIKHALRDSCKETYCIILETLIKGWLGSTSVYFFLHDWIGMVALTPPPKRAALLPGVLIWDEHEALILGMKSPPVTLLTPCVLPVCSPQYRLKYS